MGEYQIRRRSKKVYNNTPGMNNSSGSKDNSPCMGLSPSDFRNLRSNHESIRLSLRGSIGCKPDSIAEKFSQPTGPNHAINRQLMNAHHEALIQGIVQNAG